MDRLNHGQNVTVKRARYRDMVTKFSVLSQLEGIKHLWFQLDGVAAHDTINLLRKPFGERIFLQNEAVHMFCN